MNIATYEKIVRENIISIRKEKGFSQENLANASQLDRTYISMLERGIRNPTLKSLLKIAIALEIKPVQLFEGVENE